MAICFLGDIHFRADKDHFMKAYEAFLSWFANWEENNENNHLVLAGDIVHTANNGGIVIRYLERFLGASKFKTLHIVVGNHDKKILANKWQVAYDFYRESENVFIYEEETLAEIEGQKILMCPYFLGVDKNGKTMKDAYSTISERYKNLDAVVGHFGDPSSSFGDGPDCIENLEKISCKKVIGHIHTRVTPEMHIGSVVAQSKAENDPRRAAWILKNGKWNEELLPIFTEFLEVIYPDPLPKSEAVAPIYTVLNCASESVARSKYGNIFIRRTTANLTDGQIKLEEKTCTSVKDMNVKTLFAEFMKVNKDTYPAEVLDECNKMLG